MSGNTPQEKLLIWGAVAFMLFIGLTFLAGLLFFNKRLKDEQKTVPRDANEAGESLNPKPDASHFQGRDFQPQAQISDDPFHRP